VQGGRQNVWTAGVNWYPTEPLRFSLEYEHADLAGGKAPRSLNAIAMRAQLEF
jgi:phosphate-selective porin